MSTGLVDHGIHTENSHIRAHVAPGTKRIFIFKTAAVLGILANGYCMKTATQPRVGYPTAAGYAVPWRDIPDIREVKWWSARWWEGFSREMSTSAKGYRAVEVVCDLLKIGRFPLWAEAAAVDDISVDIDGTDIMVFGKWRIQVKCDYYAGPRSAGGTGNLFIQVAECNPLKLYSEPPVESKDGRQLQLFPEAGDG